MPVTSLRMVSTAPPTLKLSLLRSHLYPNSCAAPDGYSYRVWLGRLAMAALVWGVFGKRPKSFYR